ncbi:AAA family ATPase [Polaromonas sp. UC242_47]|uniref:AAA family ATPase n=1 Tax=Polaromonas sp. UC242_47 TaxID=3374626 RepID=UPI00379B415D
MLIKQVTVSGLFGKNSTETYHFNADLNLVTGRNGSGKTTLIKLIWSIMSGNILLALNEVNFKACSITTSEYICTVTRTGAATCKVELDVNGEIYIFEDEDPDDVSFAEAAEDKAAPYLISRGSSLFFPTFRRIEGGFSMSVGPPSRVRPGGRVEADIDTSLASISRKLSNKEHTFVSAISSQDIVGLLLKQYASLSDDVNAFQENVTSRVINKIRQYENTQSVGHNADALLSETRSEIEKIEAYRADVLQPFTAVRGLVEKLFKHAGISFGRRLSFGDAAAAINSDALSAGEKQMLSFICYNAFHKNTVVFIDEPELSLHVDWQRRLVSILESQNSGNQFVFATHSPFIYGKYPDKELIVGEDRGD